ncbi:MAG TPA: hypothetical protein VHO94_02855 [Oscillospiraceae bacterium]|nr:hypothetical protein [Oscillospiraceae bacterium]
MTNKDFKTKNKVIMELLKGDDTELITETLEKIMDDELMKPDDQIDFDLIDECVKMIYVYNEKDLPEETKDNAVIPFPNLMNKFNIIQKMITRVAVIAGITLIVAFVGNSISASAFHVNVFGNIVQWAQNKVTFNWQEENSSVSSVSCVSNARIYDPLYSKLKDNNLTGVMLPNYNLESWKIGNVKVAHAATTPKISFVLSKDNDYINYYVTKFANEEKMGQETLLGQYTTGEEFDYNGMKFYMLKKDGNTSVLFTKQLTEYMLFTSFDMATTKEVLKTIK